jgi:tetratricopeptide (TPR) repeat protein
MKQWILGVGLFLGFCGISAMALAQQNASQQALLSAIQANPNDGTAHFNLGVSYFNGQKYDLAVPEFQKCLQINPNDKQSKEMLESSQGISAYFLHNYPEAVDHLQKALQVNPQNPNANIMLADSYVHLQQYPNAETVLKNYSMTSPEGKEKASEVLSKIYMDQKRYVEAVAELKNIVEASSGNFEAYENLGVAYFQMKDYKNAAHYWENAAKLQKDAQTFKFLGFSYYNLGDFPDAIDNYKKSIQLESSKPPQEQNSESLDETYFNLAVAYNDNALYDDAADAFQQAFKINPKDSNAAVGQAQAIDASINAHMEKASNFLLNNQYSDAIAEWQKVLKYQPDNQQAQGFITDAQAKLKLEVDKHYAAGKSYAQKGDTLQALNEWNLGLQMDPANEDIQKALKKLKSKKNDRTKALMAEAEEYYQSNDLLDAIHSYEQAKEIDPHNPKIKKRLKQLESKQSDESDSTYTKALKSYSEGDLKSALKYLQMAKQIDSSSSKVAAFLFKVQKDITVKVKDLDAEGISLFEGNEKEKAKAKFQEVLKLKSNDDTANDYVKQMTGQQSQAKADAEQAKTLYYDGVSLYINGNIHEAIAKWNECLKADPGYVSASENIKKAEAKLQSIEKLSNG